MNLSTMHFQEDIFAPVKKKTAKKSVVPTNDDALFKDDTDIFSDIPAAKPKEKKSKKKAVPKPLFKSDVGKDICSLIRTHLVQKRKI